MRSLPVGLVESLTSCLLQLFISPPITIDSYPTLLMAKKCNFYHLKTSDCAMLNMFTRNSDSVASLSSNFRGHFVICTNESCNFSTGRYITHNCANSFSTTLPEDKTGCDNIGASSVAGVCSVAMFKESCQNGSHVDVNATRP